MFYKKFIFILLSINSIFGFNLNKLIMANDLNNYKNNCNKLRRNILYTGIGISSYNLLKPIKTNAENTNNLLNYIEEKQKELYDKTLSSVCYISTEYTSMGEKFDLNSEDLPKGVGTGFIWDKSGHIITNFHVINKVDNALVTITKKIKKQ